MVQKGSLRFSTALRRSERFAEVRQGSAKVRKFSLMFGEVL